MTKKCLLIAGTLAAFACLLLVAIALLPMRTGVTKANFDRIEKGMMYADVEAIFDEPAWFDHGDHTRHLADWRREDGAVARVVFVDGSATDILWFDSTETFSEKFRRWLHLPPE
jgi:hypothetical protein